MIARPLLDDFSTRESDLEASFIKPTRGECELQFRNLSYTVRNRKNLLVLDQVTGYVPANKITAIFGPTGAGKTTLLDVLARRKNSSWVDGDVFVNGHKQTDGFKRMSGYVVQDDLLSSNLTVRESIEFSAALRLPDDAYTKEAKALLVEATLAELKLTRVADTLIGNELERGVSGGERKRTNIGCELVCRPSVLFLDEPTTGLDAATAVSVIESIRSLSNTTVAMTIHQPRFAVFKLFDRIMLLSKGRIVYAGAPLGIVDHLSTIGFVCEEHNNPADYMFDAMLGVAPPLAGSAGDKLRNEDVFYSAYQSSKEKQSIDDRIDLAVTNSHTKPDLQLAAMYGASTFRQFFILCGRYLLGMRRLPIILVAQLVVMVIMGFSMGGIYYQLDFSAQGLQNRIGLAFFLTMTASFSNLGALEILTNRRALFIHERASGYYSTGPYFCATVLCDLLPMRIFPFFVLGCILYPMCGLQATWEHFAWFQFTLVSTAVCAGALCYMVSSAIGIFAVANLVVSLIYVMMMLFGGMLISLETLPWFMRWIHYTSIFQQGYANFIINELHGLKFKLAKFVHVTGDDVLKSQSLSHDDLWKNIGLMWGFGALYLILGYLFLRRVRKD